MFYLHACLCVTFMQYLWSPENGLGSFETGVTGVVSYHIILNCHVNVENQKPGIGRAANARQH